MLMSMLRVLFPALLLLVCRSTSALHVTINGGAEECFNVDAQEYKHGVSLNYEVLKGIADGVEVKLTDGQDQVIYRNQASSGRFVAPIGEGGTHTACFRNVVTSVGKVIVGFSFHADDPSHDVVSNADAARIQQLQELEDLVYDLTVDLDTVKDSQAYMRSITRYHDEVIQSTHRRVLWWAGLEAALLAAVAFGQIAYLRRTLEVRRIL